jgi:hypothetical protein
LVQSLVDAARPGFMWLYDRAVRYRAVLLFAVLIGLSLHALWESYRGAINRDLVIYTGLRGSPSWHYGRLLRDALLARHTALGGSYRVRVEETDGDKEIRQNVRNDKTGSAIGFLLDRTANAPGAKMIAPLERECLHVMVRSDLVKPKIQEIKPGEPATLTAIGADDVFERGRVYLGPLGSATRELAETVLDEFDRPDAGFYAANGIGDWYELRSAFAGKTISAGFFMTATGTEVIKRIIGDDTAVLLDTSDINEALAAAYPELSEFKIPQKYYHSAHEIKHLNDRAISTIAARSMIVASDAVQDYDAYQVAVAADAALVDFFPKGLWKQSHIEDESEFATPIHAGGELAKAGKAPAGVFQAAYWPSWLIGLGSALASVLAASFLKWMRDRAEGKAAAAGTSASSSSSTEARVSVTTGATASEALYEECLKLCDRVDAIFVHATAAGGLPDEARKELLDRLILTMSNASHALARPLPDACSSTEETAPTRRM